MGDKTRAHEAVTLQSAKGRLGEIVGWGANDGSWPKAATPYAGRSIHQPSPILSCG